MKLRLLACAIALFPLATLAAGEPAAKQDPIVPLVKIDDFNLTDMHFSVFAAQHGDQAQSRAQQIRLLNELVNTFMVAHSAKGRELAQNPELKAAMEVANARLLARAVIRDLMDHTEISDDQVKKVYQEKYAGVKRHEYKARHILLKSKDEAKAVIKELQQGADFPQLAKDKSTGPSASVGGDLGWFTPDSMVKPFAEAVAAMKDGEYTKTPVKTRFGWHVILREDSRELPTRTLDEVRDEIVDDLKTEKLSAYIQGLRDKTDIQVLGADAAVVK